VENEVQPNIPPVQPLPQTPPVSTPSTNWSKILLSTIIGLIVITGSVFIGIQIGKNQLTNQQSINEQPIIPLTQATTTPTVLPTTPSPTINPTTDWKTYINTKYRYQLLYPSDWLVQAMNGGEQLTQTSVTNFRMNSDKTPAESGFSFSVLSNPNNLSLTDWIKQNPDNGTLLLGVNKINSSIVSLNEQKWEKIDNDSIGYVPTGFVKYGLAHNGNLYYVVIYSTNTKTLEQILSTLRFNN
jgi:hypothetical protein